MSAKPSAQRVVIVGASDKSDRYANMAQRLLSEHGHTVVPVHPKLEEIDGVPVIADLNDVQGAVDTVTMYVGPAISAGLEERLVRLKPSRVIFNPGTENPALEAALNTAGISTEEACTLVLLRTGAF
jgi:predicted CoA-binding protein